MAQRKKKEEGFLDKVKSRFAEELDLIRNNKPAFSNAGQAESNAVSAEDLARKRRRKSGR